MIDVAPAALRLEPAAAWIGLGGNVGDSRAHLRAGLFSLATHPEIEVRDVSSLYLTRYVGPGAQDDYLNACVGIVTTLPPRVLLMVLKLVEQRRGREPGSHMEPRPLDMDILVYGDLVAADPVLTLPHPRLAERAFALEPLAEIAPDLVLPDSGLTAGSACERIRSRGGQEVRPLPSDPQWPRPLAGRKEDWRASLAVHSR